jgi:hypothetical protein
MPEIKTPAQDASARRRSQHRRVKRGIVASYIHQLSERHSATDAAKPGPVMARAEEKVA